MSLTLNELSISSWQRRLFARHYPYFDYAELTTVVGYVESTALAAAQGNILNGLQSGNTWYQFGTNTRQKTINVVSGALAGTQNWPSGCFGREILLYCDQNAYAGFIVTNPEYLKEYTVQLSTSNQERASASQLLYEKDFLIPSGVTIRRFLYYGYGIVFRADTIADTLSIWIEGSVVGDES